MLTVNPLLLIVYLVNTLIHTYMVFYTGSLPVITQHTQFTFIFSRLADAYPKRRTRERTIKQYIYSSTYEHVLRRITPSGASLACRHTPTAQGPVCRERGILAVTLQLVLSIFSDFTNVRYIFTQVSRTRM